MKKDIKEQVKYYCSLPYQVVIEKWDDGRGPYYVSRVLELPGCMMTGETPEEALKELEDVKPEWIETNLELGNKMPEPLSTHKYSGSIVLRLPSSLHETLAKFSQLEGVSLNQYMVSALSRAVGRDEVLVKERKNPYKKK
jgi:antitoxin HicB